MADNRKYTIRKQIEVSAAHRLPAMPDGHPCKRLHGHNYSISVALQSATLDRDTGMVWDFTNFKQLKTILDHRDLNEIFDAMHVGPTTSENLCRFVWEWVDKKLWQDLGDDRGDVTIVEVTVSETDTSSATLAYG